MNVYFHYIHTVIDGKFKACRSDCTILTIQTVPDDNISVLRGLLEHGAAQTSGCDFDRQSDKHFREETLVG